MKNVSQSNRDLILPSLSIQNYRTGFYYFNDELCIEDEKDSTNNGEGTT